MKSFLLISLFFCNAICAQNDYITYHQQCRKAERFFIQQQPDSAIALFQLTFQSFPYLFPRDCYMAAQIAQHHNNDSAAVGFLISAFEFGLRIAIPLTKKHQKQLYQALGKGYDSFWHPLR